MVFTNTLFNFDSLCLLSTYFRKEEFHLRIPFGGIDAHRGEHALKFPEGDVARFSLDDPARRERTVHRHLTRRLVTVKLPHQHL